MSDFRNNLAKLMKAKFPYIYVCTFEEDRILELIEKTAVDERVIKTPREVITWSQTEGLVQNGKSFGQADMKQPIRVLEFIEKFEKPAIFVLKDFHIYFGGSGRTCDTQIVRKLRDIAPKIKLSPAPQNVVLVCPSLVLPSDLQKDLTILDYDLPDAEEMRGLLRVMIETNRKTGRIVFDLNGETEERLAKAALGLTVQEAENAFARAMVEDGRLAANDVAVILEEKAQIIKKSEILEYVRTDITMKDVGGLSNLKRWLKKRDRAWLDEAKVYCLPAPKGVLLTGIPGCGKSLCAKAVAEMWQLPLLRLDVGRIFSGIVGSSEENVRRALRTAEAIAPSVLWIDEIEKGFSGVASSGDSGTSSRVFATFLTWMQEKTKPVFVVATANNIDQLPPEFMRKGRFDEVFFVDLPTRRERMAIFSLHLQKRLKDPRVAGNVTVGDELNSRLAGMTEGFSGSEIEYVVINALFDAFAERRSLLLSDLEKAVENTVPLSVTQAEQIKAIRNWANVRAVAATPKDERAEYTQATPADGKSGTPPDETKDLFSSRGGRTIDF